ncbi:hypothetical protein HPB49_003745 [Dermacentor silvarum]|uniref:Uncharacterized protein n=1 Tax=Dermacentor silvarum TaxID=543639 RepID=A0ACB8CD61_DERSI|nr:hypothetical protein HPB49_003745 [Dermacentor silvarum]
MRRYASWVPIDPITMSFVMKAKALRHVSVKRTQYSLVPASAMAIHKSQAGTFHAVVYDYAKSGPQKLVYVALSRVTSIKRLYLTDVEQDHRFYHHVDNPDRALMS